MSSICCCAKTNRVRWNTFESFCGTPSQAEKKLSAARLQQVVERKVPKPEAISLMETLAEVWMQQGLQQGLQQKSAEYSLELATRALRRLQRFGPISPEAQEQVRALPFNRLIDLIEAIVDFHSADDFTAWMRQPVLNEMESTIN
jgi:hypothetical protein